MGTPHRGSESASLAKTMGNIANLAFQASGVFRSSRGVQTKLLLELKQCPVSNNSTTFSYDNPNCMTAWLRYVLSQETLESSTVLIPVVTSELPHGVPQNGDHSIVSRNNSK